MYGSGAAGSVFASYLRNGGADIILIDRYEAHMKNVAENAMSITVHAKREGNDEYEKIAAPLLAKGFTVTQSEVDPTYDDIQAVLPGFRTYTCAKCAEEAEGKVDVIIYMTKATQLVQAMTTTSSSSSPKTAASSAPAFWAPQCPHPAPAYPPPPAAFR